MSTLLRVATAGSVDDGKSTLIGRLLHDSKGILEDQWSSIDRVSKYRGHDHTDLSLLTDGLRSEREQGITIDVAYRYFTTPNRKFIIADTPGHAQHTRNMVTGASTAQLAVVLVDARNGLVEQSRRHAFISSLLGIRNLVVAVNKMDLIDWDQHQFDSICSDFHAFAALLDISNVLTIPISALNGDNVVAPSENSPWHVGPTLLNYLENVHVADEKNLIDMRLPVQYVMRPERIEQRKHRRYAGTIAGGILRPGDEVVALPSGVRTRIATLAGPDGPINEAITPMPVSVTLDDDLDVARGDMIVREDRQPRLTQDIEAMICWMSEDLSLTQGVEYIAKQTTRTTRIRVTDLDYRLNITTLKSDYAATSLNINDIGRVCLRAQTPLAVDEYHQNAVTGSLILIDPITNSTVAAGMILPKDGAEWFRKSNQSSSESKPHTEVYFHESLVEAKDRLSQGATVWLTGLSGSGKSTTATMSEAALIKCEYPAFVLDGDNLRDGLNADLGFTMHDRTENLRRLAHISALLAQSGQITLVPTISPLQKHRNLARQIHEQFGIPFYEVYIDTPLDVCETRDSKRLYVRARAGEIENFTGVNSPYEPPKEPDMRLRYELSPEEQSAQILALLKIPFGMSR